MLKLIGTLFVSICLIGIVISDNPTSDPLMRPCHAEDFVSTYTVKKKKNKQTNKKQFHLIQFHF